MLLESIIDLASSIGLLGLVGSFIGAFVIYNRKQVDRREAMIRAIFTELLSTEYLDRAYVITVADDDKDHRIELEVDQEEGVPVNQFLSTDVGASYFDDFGLLEGEDIEAVVGYYSEAEMLNNIIRTRRTYEMNTNSGDDRLVDQMSNIVAGEILEVKRKRDVLLRRWCSKFGYTREDLIRDHGIYMGGEVN